MEMTRALFNEQRRPRFGTSNPERMQLAFWEWMIRGDDGPAHGDGDLLGEYGLIIRRGILKSSYGPYRARDLFDVPLNPDDGPIWTFDRMGATRTELPDGRIVCVGGEHEDYYDPDFCIYNDVVVFTPADEIEIYGYPREVFPPTDFHTATLAEDRLIIIGRLGYPDERQPGTTPVFALDLSDYRVSELASRANVPGWLFEHEAHIERDGVIMIRGGKVFEEHSGTARIRRNFEDYLYEIDSGRWRRVSNRNWTQFTIRPEEKKILLMGPRSCIETDEPELICCIPAEAMVPRRIPYEILTHDGEQPQRILVSGIPVSISMQAGTIEVVVEGKMDAALALRLAEDLRASIEAECEWPCHLETCD